MMYYAGYYVERVKGYTLFLLLHNHVGRFSEHLRKNTKQIKNKSYIMCNLCCRRYTYYLIIPKESKHFL